MKRKIERSSILAAYIDCAVHTPKGEGLLCDPHCRNGLSPRSVLARSFALSRALKRQLAEDERRVGILLPTTIGNVLTFWALHLLHRTPTMLNFVSGLLNVLNASKITVLKTIITSRAFVEKASLAHLVEGLSEAGLQILYLEDMTQNISIADKLLARVVKTAPYSLMANAGNHRLDEEAVILFTSGSEGTPKGVALSHHNILSNVNQFVRQTNADASDRMFNCLPMYHSFGLTVGTLTPLLARMQTMLYPSPLHYHEIPRLIQENHSTVLLSTDTFLTGYAKHGSAEAFASLRLIVPGAEKLKDATVRHWKNAFGKTLYEGYGVTETSPVISVNVEGAFKEGSVGPLLPGIEHKLKPVEGIDEGGELWVRGPNIMLGYIKGDKPGIVQPLADGWHNTGDIAIVDENGFLTIRGRLKRFAKIGGEMVSLVSVEQAIARVWPGILHAVVSVPHARKGEALVLLTEKQDATLSSLIAALKAGGETNVALPRQIFTVPAIPILGPGKLDFITAKKMALDLVEREAEGLLTPEEPAAEKAAG